MKLERAEFILNTNRGRMTIVFEGDTVHVLRGDAAVAEGGVKLNNAPRSYGGRPYKPCVSHAIEAVRNAFEEPEKTLSESRRRDYSRPTPRLVRYPKG